MEPNQAFLLALVIGMLFLWFRTRRRPAATARRKVLGRLPKQKARVTARKVETPSVTPTEAVTRISSEQFQLMLKLAGGNPKKITPDMLNRVTNKGI